MKKKLVSYLKKFNINIDDSDFIRPIYLKGIKTNYMVTRNGDVISIRKNSNKKLKPRIDKDGYHTVTIYINGHPYLCFIHRLVATAFIPNPDPNHKTQVNHIKGNEKWNNDVSNLEWVTPKENIHHAWDTNLSSAKYGDEHPNTVYSDDIVRKVCQHFVDNKLTMKEISEKTGVSYTVVKQIRNHIIHNNISSEYDFNHYNRDGRSRYNKEQIALAIGLLIHKYCITDVSLITGIKKSTVRLIQKNKYNTTHISSDDINKYYNEFSKSQ